jgi:hypothetical protein
MTGVSKPVENRLVRSGLLGRNVRGETVAVSKGGRAMKKIVRRAIKKFIRVSCGLLLKEL